MTEKIKIQFVHVFCLAFRFRRYVKALVGFRAFYFSVGFRCICEMALTRLGMSVTTQGGSGRQFVTGL